MKHLLTAILLLAAAPVAAQTVHTAGGDWSSVPAMPTLVGATIEADAVSEISNVVGRDGCVIPGQRHRYIDMRVPFLVLFNASGSVERLVIRPQGCARVDAIIAGAVLRMVQRGGVQPVGGRREGWFRGDVGFAHSDG